MSDTRTIHRLLVAYTLCQDSIEAHRLLTDHIKNALFLMGMIAYYSAMGSDSQAKRDLRDDLLGDSDLPVGSKIYLRTGIPGVQQKGVGAALWDIFRKNKRIRDEYIAHNRSRDNIPGELMWARIPEQVAGEGPPDEYPYGVHVCVDTFPHLAIEEKYHFVALIGVSIDLRWQRGDKLTPSHPDTLPS